MHAPNRCFISLAGMVRMESTSKSINIDNKDNIDVIGGSR